MLVQIAGRKGKDLKRNVKDRNIGLQQIKQVVFMRFNIIMRLDLYNRTSGDTQYINDLRIKPRGFVLHLNL